MSDDLRLRSLADRSLKIPQDLCAGLLFMIGAAFVLWQSWNYPAGSAARMEYGYFPRAIAVGLLLVGTILTIKSFAIAGPQITRLACKPMIPFLGVIAFGLTIYPLGVLAATTLLVIVSSVASERFRVWEVLILALALAAFNWLVFVKGLGLPIPVWPEGS